MIEKGLRALFSLGPISWFLLENNTVKWQCMMSHDIRWCLVATSASGIAIPQRCAILCVNSALEYGPHCKRYSALLLDHFRPFWLPGMALLAHVCFHNRRHSDVPLLQALCIFPHSVSEWEAGGFQGPIPNAGDLIVTYELMVLLVVPVIWLHQVIISVRFSASPFRLGTRNSMAKFIFS